MGELKGLVLSGGAGTRLRPITHTRAKQLVPVANTPVLFYGLRALAAAGICEVGIIVGDTRAEIEEAVGDGSAFGLRIEIIPQEAPGSLWSPPSRASAAPTLQRHLQTPSSYRPPGRPPGGTSIPPANNVRRTSGPPCGSDAHMNHRYLTVTSVIALGVGLAPTAVANVAPPLEPPPETTPSAPPPATTAPVTTVARPQQTIFTFTGRGWGHGVGMSQWGARGRALAGWSTPRILRHYYRGTKLTRVRNRRIRVLLHTSVARGQVTADGPWRIVTEGAGRTVRNLKPGVVYRVVVRDGRVAVLNPKGQAVTTAPASLRFEPRGSTVLRMRKPGGIDYRGWLRFRLRAGLTDTINSVPLTQYLQGVVPREMPSAWGDDAPAALRAQAIAARSYALATRRRGGYFDVYKDTRSQVYGGVPAEDPRANRAVQATKRVVLAHQGTVIPAFFFSTSGGRTENNESVWPGPPRSYLRSVPDTFDRVSPLHRWPDRPSFTPAGLGKRLELDGPVTAMKVLSRGASPRVKEVLVVTRSGRRTRLTGAQIRARLGLRDTWFSVSRRRQNP